MLSKLLKGQPKKSALSISIHPFKDFTQINYEYNWDGGGLFESALFLGTAELCWTALQKILWNRTEHNFFQKNPNAEPTQRRCAFKVLSLLLPLACAQPTHVYLHKYLYSFVIFAFKLLFSISFKV